MSNSETGVIVSNRGAWTEIVLNRPERLNAITPALAADVIRAVDAANGRSACRAVLLTGAGRAFCAGQDLALRDPRNVAWPPDLSASLKTVHNPLIRALVSSRVPVVCAVNGIAAGAGAGLAMACDVTLAAESATFSFGFTRIGLMPDAGVGWQLVRRAGAARARALCLTGASITAREAASWGLIWKSLPDEMLLTNAREMTRQLADGPQQALHVTRQALGAAAQNTLDDQLDLESRLQGDLGRTDDYREGVLAFLEKRSARFDRSQGNEEI